MSLKILSFSIFFFGVKSPAAMRTRNEFCISLSEQKRKFKGAGDALIISFLHGEEVVGELKEGENFLP
jgi:hypothetical protein